MGKKIIRTGVLSGQRLLIIFLDRSIGFLGDPPQRFLFHSQFDQSLVEQGQGVAFCVIFQVIAVPFHAHTRGVVAQQGHFQVHQKRSSLGAHLSQDVLHFLVDLGEVIAVQTSDFKSVESAGKFSRVLCAGFFGIGRDVPLVVLNEEQDRKLLEYSHLKGFRDLAFCHCGIANGAHDNRRFAFPPNIKPLLLAVLNAHGQSSRWDGLHSRSRRLMDDLGFVLILETRVAVVGAAARKGILFFGQ